MTDDPDLVAAARSIEPDGRLVATTPLTGGVSARVVRIEVATRGGGIRTAVFRQHDDRTEKEHGADVAAKEFALLRLLDAHGVPVARPLALHGPDATGGTWLVTEFVDGSSRIAPAQLGPALDAMADVLVAVHAVPLDAAVPGLRPIEDPRDHLGLDVERRPNTAGLVHGDYWPGNLLFRRDRVLAVLDWEDAVVGDPLVDLAVARVELTCAYGDEAAASFTERYRSRTRIDDHDLALWELYVATTALEGMHRWGLDPGVEAERRAATSTCRQRAADELLRRRGSG